MLDFFNARIDIRRKAGEIYGAIVTQARRPEFYALLGVPDTPAGRYDMVVLHLFLVLERLRAAGNTSPLSRLLVEAFIADMDDSLRELATGDLSVPKKVRRAATGLYERSMAYRSALELSDEAALSAALSAHVYAGAGEDARAGLLARYVNAAAGALAAAETTEVLAGQIAFPDPPSIAEAK
jgi:cytochrome b pre-mRNA-processing protein 3